MVDRWFLRSLLLSTLLFLLFVVIIDVGSPSIVFAEHAFFITPEGSQLRDSNILKYHPGVQTNTETTKLVIFSDSMSDTNRDFSLTNETWPDESIYFHGRFSNGLVWHEYLARALGLDPNQPSCFAYGGATTDSNIVQGYTGFNEDIPVPGIAQQVDMYLETLRANKTTPQHDALHVFSISGNDLYFSLKEGKLPGLVAMANSFSSSMQKLYDEGARKFFVLNMPAIGYFPIIAQSYLPTSVANTFVQWYNTHLETSVQRFIIEHTDANVILFDLFKVTEDILTHGEEYGFQVVDQSCLDSSQTPIQQCEDPEQYAFWDSFHFTTSAHQLMGEATAIFLEDVFNFYS